MPARLRELTSPIAVDGYSGVVGNPCSPFRSCHWRTVKQLEWLGTGRNNGSSETALFVELFFSVQRAIDVEIRVDSLSSIVWREFCLPPGLRHMCLGMFSYDDVFLTVLMHAKELKNEETARFCETAILEI